MKKLILPMIICMFLISLAASLSLSAGENYTLQLSEPYSYYEITENSSKIDINITKNGTDALIKTSRYLEDCFFKITFYNEKNEVIKSSGGGGGGAATTYWICGDWSRCLNGTQTKICYDKDDNFKEKTETRDCIPEYTPLSSEGGSSSEENIEENKENSEQTSTNFFTGAVSGITEFVKTEKRISLLILIIALIIVFIIVKVLRK